LSEPNRRCGQIWPGTQKYHDIFSPSGGGARRTLFVCSATEKQKGPSRKDSVVVMKSKLTTIQNQKSAAEFGVKYTGNKVELLYSSV